MPNSRMVEARQIARSRRPCGIIRVTALCPLCRYRHNCHSTSHSDRLDRETLRRYSETIAVRAKEELIAEIGAALLCAALGMAPNQREDRAAYVAHWLSASRHDKRAIFQAATSAQAASDHILTGMVRADTGRVAA